MIADMQRARMMCHHLGECGWEAEVVAPDLSHQPPQCVEPGAEEFFARGVPFHSARPVGAKLWDAAGASTIAWRGLWPVKRQGERVLRARKFDAVFVSTAHYLLALAAKSWRREFGVPFFIDLHDPWHSKPSTSTAPRQRLKHRFVAWFSAWAERSSLQAVRGVVSVSPGYLQYLEDAFGSSRFSWQRTGSMIVEPFGFEPADHVIACRSMECEAEPPRRVAYCGAGGRVMRESWSFLCSLLQRLSRDDAGDVDKVLWDLRGTALHYKPGDRCEMHAWAEEKGIGDLVLESPSRVTYADSIRFLYQARGVLLLGVDAPVYMASKLFSYLYSGKPVLAVIRAGSVMQPYLDRQEGVWVLHFGPYATPAGDAGRVLQGFLRSVVKGERFDRKCTLADFTASAMTRRLVAFMQRAIHSER